MAPELPGAPEQLVRAELNRADRLRRATSADRRLWRAAPMAAAACAAVAAVGRVVGWPGAIAVAFLLLAILSLALFVVVARRDHALSDQIAVELDDTARLEGELRSAYYFAGHETRDAWVDYHLARAARRLEGVDWRGLYPAARAGRAKAATAILAVATLALALFVPGRAGVFASAPKATSATAEHGRGAAADALPLTVAEILAKLDQLLVSAEAGNGKAISASDVRGLLEQLDKLKAEQAEALNRKDAAKQSKAPTAADLKAFAERAKKAAENDKLSPEVRDSLADMSEKLKEEAQAQAAGEKDPKDASSQGDTESTETAQAQSGSSNKQDGGAQSVKEAAGGGGRRRHDDQRRRPAAKEAGLGVGGAAGDSRRTARWPNLAPRCARKPSKPLKTNDGEKTVTGERRKTERGARNRRLRPHRRRRPPSAAAPRRLPPCPKRGARRCGPTSSANNDHNRPSTNPSNSSANVSSASPARSAAASSGTKRSST